MSVIALEGGFPVGAAWFRLFTRDEPGFGFVDEQTPEVAIAVVPSRRGRGIGSELLDALIEVAKEQGYGSAQPQRGGGQPCNARLRERGIRDGRADRRLLDDAPYPVTSSRKSTEERETDGM